MVPPADGAIRAQAWEQVCAPAEQGVCARTASGCRQALDTPHPASLDRRGAADCEGGVGGSAEPRHCLFAGDVLFSGGQGAPFEGAPIEMLQNLHTVLAAVSRDTLVFPGHEYTERLLAKQLEEADGSLSAHRFMRIAAALQRAIHRRSFSARADRLPTVPVHLEEEMVLNPALREAEERRSLLRRYLLIFLARVELRAALASRAAAQGGSSGDAEAASDTGRGTAHAGVEREDGGEGSEGDGGGGVEGMFGDEEMLPLLAARPCGEEEGGYFPHHIATHQDFRDECQMRFFFHSDWQAVKSHVTSAKARRHACDRHACQASTAGLQPQGQAMSAPQPQQELFDIQGVLRADSACSAGAVARGADGDQAGDEGVALLAATERRLHTVSCARRGDDGEDEEVELRLAMRVFGAALLPNRKQQRAVETDQELVYRERLLLGMADERERDAIEMLFLQGGGGDTTSDCLEIGDAVGLLMQRRMHEEEEEADEVGQGWVLSCCCIKCGDARVDQEGEEELPRSMAATLSDLPQPDLQAEPQGFSPGTGEDAAAGQKAGDGGFGRTAGIEGLDDPGKGLVCTGVSD